MRNFLLITIFLASFTTIFGQISFSPDPIVVTASTDTENIQTDFELKNEGTDTVFLAWTLQVGAQPESWMYYVCDTENCYNLNQDAGSEERPNVIPPGESIIVMFHTLPDNVEGLGEYTIRFFDINFRDSLNVEIPIEVNTSTSSTHEKDFSGLSVFPNPTNDFFRVNTGNLVSNIEVVTIVGKKVASFQARQGAYYDVSDLSTGIYYVRLIDAAGDSVKVMKLKKN